jgi:hypothetical protein
MASNLQQRAGNVMIHCPLLRDLAALRIYEEIGFLPGTRGKHQVIY